MDDINKYYEPLVHAKDEYKSVSEEILIKENFLKYCEEVLGKKDKNKKFKRIVKMNKKERKDAWTFVRSANVSYLFVAGFIVAVLFVSGILGPILKALVLFLFFSGLGAVNVVTIALALKEELEYRYLSNYLMGLDDKDLDLKKVIKMINSELVTLREKKDDLASYLKEYESALMIENNKVANQVLVSKGIDAKIDVSIKEKEKKNSIKEVARKLVLENLFRD